MIRVRAADGQVLVSLGPSFGEWLTYDQIPPEMREAMISVEDRRFRSHIGVDPIGIARSVEVRGELPAIGARAARPSPSSSRATSSSPTTGRFGRKIHEAILALALERKFSKDQILELYLNKVYFGGGAYGIDAASPQILRPRRRPAEPGRSGDHRRPGQGAVQLFADRRRRSRARPRGRGAQTMVEERLHQRRTAAAASNPAAVTLQADAPTRTACAISPTGRCRSSTR